MDFVISILTVVGPECAPFCCCCICSSIKRTLKLQSNFNELEKEMKSLTDLRNDVRKLEPEEKDGKSTTQREEEWLREVEKLENEVNSARESITEMKNTKVCGCFSSWRGRCRLGKEVVRMLDEVERLQISWQH